MVARNHVVIGIACIAVAVMTRIIAKAYFKNPPAQTLAMPRESEFSTGREIL